MTDVVIRCLEDELVRLEQDLKSSREVLILAQTQVKRRTEFIEEINSEIEEIKEAINKFKGEIKWKHF